MIAPIKNRLLNVLLADDGALDAHSAIQLLNDLPHVRECEITALRVFTPLEGSEFSNVEAEVEKTKDLLKSGNFNFHSEVIMGYPSETIIEYTSQHSPDLIVMGVKEKGLLGDLLGSVAANVVHSGKWPVLIVRHPYNGLKRVLLVTDGSSTSHFTYEYLGAFSLPPQTRLEVMHVIPSVRTVFMVEPAGLVLPTLTPEDEARLNRENEIQGDEILERACYELGMQGMEAKRVLRTGDSVEQILNYIETNQIDMLVCGSRGIGNLTGWLLGSVSRELVLRAPCSVLVVRSPDKN